MAGTASFDGDLGAALGAVEPIALDELIALAELQTRSARKYIIDVDVVEQLASEMSEQLAVLEIDGDRSFGYETIYFDTPDRQLYLQTAYRRPRRFKVRTRRYSTGDTAMLEVKAKNGRGATVKHRRDHPPERRSELSDENRRWISTVAGDHHDPGIVDALEASLVTEFSRATAVERSGAARYTFDERLVCSTLDGRSTSLDHIVLECKSEQGPSSLDRWLWRHGVRPTRLSKYCVGLGTLEPSLPTNHWHRTLNEYFAA